MTIPTTSWDETSPAGTDNLNQGDNRIRELKTQIREVISTDHQFNSSGQDSDNGKHEQVSLLEQADLGTGAEGKPILGAQTVSGKAELVFTDEDDNDIQITDNGQLSGAGLVSGGAIADTTLKTAILNLLYPVGTIYTEITGTNPGTTFGIGTWTAFGAGRVPVGYNSGDTDFDTAEETGGAKTHTLTTDEIPAHTHDVENLSNGTAGGDFITEAGTSATAGSQATSSVGGGSAHNNLQPYIVVHMWKRTA